MKQLVTLVAVLLLTAGVGRGQSIEDLVDRSVNVSDAPPAKADETDYVSDVFDTPATGVVVRGRSMERDLRGWVRFVVGSEAGPWHPLHIVFSATGPTFLAGYHGTEVIDRGSFDLRFDRPAELTIEEAGVFDNRRDVDRTGSETGSGNDVGGGREDDSTEHDHHDARLRDRDADLRKRSGEIVAPRMISRAEWGAEPFAGDPVALARPNYIYLTFHHAAGFGAETLSQGKQQVFNIQDFHQKGRGWSDIGYQFLMDESGRIYQGRPFLNGPAPLSDAPPLVLGAHVGGHNTGNIGICALGCYHPPAGSECRDVLSEQSVDSLAVMLAFLSENYGVPPERLRGHRDFSATACPGDNNYVLIDDLRDRIELLLVTGNQPIGSVRLTATADDNGAVHLEWAFLEDNGITGYWIEREYAGIRHVIYESDEPSDDDMLDAQATFTGPVVYRLYARNAEGREQLLGIAEANVEGAAQYVLTENFPNPFATATTIRYYLPREGMVRLAVYDVLGREVDVLVSAFQDGDRWYHAQFEAGDLGAGTYFYRLTVESFSGIEFKQERSLILVR